MNAPNVRSATVRLNAEVAKYMADMRMAGKVTDDAFAKIHSRMGLVDRDARSAQKSVQGLARSSGTLDKRLLSASSSMEKLAAASSQTHVGIAAVDRDTVRLGTSMQRTGNIIDRTSGRLRLFAEAAVTAGPGLIPLGAAGAVGLAGLAGLFTSATVGALGLAAATQGVGDALKAVEKARLEPTVENIRAARQEMRRIGPEAREWVLRVQEVLPVLRRIRDAGAAGLFPGLTESIGDFERLEPLLTRFMSRVGRAGGDVISDATESLTSERWEPFLRFLSREAPDAIRSVSTLVGDLAHGAAEMWMEFDPGNDRFVDWALDVADAFDRYASSEKGRQDIAKFLDYAAENGPEVADFFVATADAITQIVQAAAPLGGPTLQILTAVAETTAAIADSDIGTPALAGLAAYAALNRVLLITSSLQGKLAATSAAGGAKGGGLFASLSTGAAATRTATRNIRSDLAVLGPAYASAATRSQRLGVASKSLAGNLGAVVKANGRIIGSVGAMAAVLSGAAGEMNLTNTATLGMIHPLAAIPGYMLDIKAATDQMSDALDNADLALKSGDLYEMEAALAALETQAAATSESLQTSGVTDFLSEQIDPAAIGARFESGWSWVRGKDSPLEQASESTALLEDAIAAAANEADAASGSNSNYTTSLRETDRAAAALDAGLGSLVEAMLEQRNTALSAFDAVTQYREALKAARAQADKNNAGIKGNSKAALENRHALSSLAAAWNNQSAAVRNNTSKFREARGAFIDTATAMGVPIDKARELARELLAIPRSRVAKVQVDSGNSLPVIHGVINALSSVRDKTVHITTVFERHNIDVNRADGGLVTGPGGPKDDLIPAMISNREYVVQAAAVDHYGVDFFDRANAMRLANGTGGPDRILTRGGNSRADEEVRRETEHRRRLNAQLKEATKAVETERRQRDALVDKMKEISSGITSSLTSELGAGGGGSVWSGEGGGTLAGNLGIVRGDTREARRVRRLIEILEGKGFEGAALADLLGRGDINEITSYAGASRRQLREFERAFAERARLVRVTSREGADAALGRRLDTANDELREANRRLNQLEHAVNRASDRNSGEHHEDRGAQRRGAGDAARNRRRNP